MIIFRRDAISVVETFRPRAASKHWVGEASVAAATTSLVYAVRSN
jgi:hypothetical protein